MLPQDVRAVANRVLELGARSGREVTNLSLNKIVYFLHAAFLHQYGQGLVSAKIEAWQHGPVFRELYHQFKDFDKRPITGLALKMDIDTGRRVPIYTSLNPEHEEFLEKVCVDLLKLPAGKLVDMSHIKDGPWDNARHTFGRINPGVTISDQSILENGRNEVRH